MAATSYGVVCLDGSKRVCLVHRKESVNFVSFISGNTDADLSLCSRSELSKLISVTDFASELWAPIKGAWRREGLETAQRRFNSMRDSGELVRRVEFAMSRAFEEPEWEFPKGRKRMSHESQRACAVREFCEETGYLIDAVNLSTVDRPFDVTFSGGDGRLYRHVYFLGWIDAAATPALAPSNHEVQDVRWFDMRCLLGPQSPLRPYDHMRRGIIQQLSAIIPSLEAPTSSPTVILRA